MKRWHCVLSFAAILLRADATWTWTDNLERPRTREDFNGILRKHELWIKTGQSVIDAPAEFQGAKLQRAHLVGANLRRSNFSNADLSGADLSDADLGESELNGLRLNDAKLYKTSFRSADLYGAHLDGANLNQTDLRGAILTDVDFKNAFLKDTHIAGARLDRAKLNGAQYEPAENPSPKDIAGAVGLGFMTWKEDSGPIFALRKSFAEAGFHKAERQVTAAIRRHDQGPVERFLFDWTCEWGAKPLRPIELAGALCGFCTFIYWIGLHLSGKSGLYLVATGQRIATKGGTERAFQIRFRRLPPVRWYPYTLMFIGRESNAFGTAGLFSLISVLNIGFREFNFGRWIRLLQPREFDLRARGWMRTVSGIQSLLGLALVALSLLSYFGHPFD